MSLLTTGRVRASFLYAHVTMTVCLWESGTMVPFNMTVMGGGMTFGGRWRNWKRYKGYVTYLLSQWFVWVILVQLFWWLMHTAAASTDTVEQYDDPGVNLTTSRSIELLLDHIYRFGHIWIALAGAKNHASRESKVCVGGMSN